jgi:hypothetical protein
MVTQTEAELAVAAKLEKDKWDLVDLEKRDEWLLKTNAALKKDKAVWTALENGPPTAEMIKLKNSSKWEASPGLLGTRASSRSGILNTGTRRCAVGHAFR